MDKTPAKLIEEKGAERIAAATGAQIGTVRVWKTRNRIPREVWPELIETFDDLSVERMKAIEALGDAA